MPCWCTLRSYGCTLVMEPNTGRGQNGVGLTSRKEFFSIPLKYFDVVRYTRTDLDNLEEYC